MCENEKNLEWGNENEPCKMEEFFKQQQKLHPNLRSIGIYLVCHCKKCRAQRGTL
jgi:hypothetical protein